MKIKLNLSKSSSAESAGHDHDETSQKKRGRPRRDPKAIKEAAVAAAKPNESELAERKSRRQAAEEKIRKSVSMEVVTSTTEPDDLDGEGRGKRPRMGKSMSSDYVDILGGPKRDLSSQPTSQSSSSSSLPTFTVNPNENEFVQKSKNILNVALQQDQGILHAPLFTPFSGLADAVERLLPHHLAMNAGQYDLDAALPRMDQARFDDAFSSLLSRFKSIIHAQHSKPVSTELLLLEQRLCLEEEKFLLQKMKSDYNARYMALASQGSSRSSTPRQ